MHVLTSQNASSLWHETIITAENRCAIYLDAELEAYLVSLLIRYTNRPDALRKAFAIAFLKAFQNKAYERDMRLQSVGDECLLVSGLFPRIAERRHVKLRYFIDLGQSAYASLSHQANDLYSTLAARFIALMDVLQSIRPESDLLPLEAYEQWEELGSEHARQVLSQYTKGAPIKR